MDMIGDEFLNMLNCTKTLFYALVTGDFQTKDNLV